MKRLTVLLLIFVMIISSASFAAPKEKDRELKYHDISDKVMVKFIDQDETDEESDVTVEIYVPKMGSELLELVVTKDNKNQKTLDFYKDGEDFDWDPDEKVYWGYYNFDEETQMYFITFDYNEKNMNTINVFVEFTAGNSHNVFQCDKDFTGPGTAY